MYKNQIFSLLLVLETLSCLTQTVVWTPFVVVVTAPSLNPLSAWLAAVAWQLTDLTPPFLGAAVASCRAPTPRSPLRHFAIPSCYSLFVIKKG